MKFLKNIIKNFRLPKQGNISDKTLTYNIVASILGVVICLFSLTAATWAWFSDGVSFASNNIQTASYAVSVSVNGTVLENADGKYTFTANESYSITLTASGTASTGYCKVVIGEKNYYTVQLFTAEGDGRLNSVTFTLQFTQGTEAQFLSCWGTYSNVERDFENGGSYTDPTPLTETQR